MNELEYYFKKVKKKVEYTRIDWVQRYYSDNRNPRIVQGKLNGISLRVGDERVIRKGEFLKVERGIDGDGGDGGEGEKVGNEGVAEEREERERNKGNCSYLLSLTQSPMISKANNFNELDGVFDRNVSNVFDHVSNDPSSSNSNLMIHPNTSCTCECHSPTQSNQLPLSRTPLPLFPPQSPQKKRYSWFKGFSKFKMTEIPLISSAIDQKSSIEITSSLAESPKQSEPIKIQMINNDQENRIQFDHLHQEIQLKEKQSKQCPDPKQSPYRQIFRRYSFAEGTRLSSVISLKEQTCVSGSRRDDAGVVSGIGSGVNSGKVWKSVLNEVSLSAARISTGGTATSKQEIGQVSADFTTREDVKDLKEDVKDPKEDVFQQTLRSAKRKYFGDYYDILSMYEHSEEGRRE